jgi:hypothetical protein
MIRGLIAPFVSGGVGADHRRGWWRSRLSLVAVAGLTGLGLVSAGVPGTAQAAGPAWSVAPNPNVLRLANGAFYGVSCVSASFCMAVGDYAQALGVSPTFAEVWNGSTWSIAPSASRGVDPTLSGVSCVSASFCIAVGVDVAANSFRTLTETWNGSHWSVVSSPNKGTGSNYLSAVSCVSASSCTAVGHYANAQRTERTLIESWDGSTWSVVPSADNTGDNYLAGVSCVSASSCTAVGHYSVTIEGNEQTLAESWDGSTWSIVPSPNSGSGSTLAGVDCISASSCTAVGDSSAGTLVESWDGSTWSVVPSPNVGTESNILSGVSCVTASFCTAVGASYSFDGAQILVETWDGSTWSVASSGGSEETSLDSVSCSSASSCTAVGSSSNSSLEVDQTVAELWNGSTWSMVTSPDQRVFTDELGGVSCVSASFCTAVGSAFTGGFQTEAPGMGVLKTVAELWNGSTWSLVHSPDKYLNNNELDSVSCLSATSCTAVGTWLTANGAHTQTLVESWNGSTWSVVTSPDTNGISESNALAGVSCVSASFCIAVGNSDGAALVESWNGSAWSIVPTPSGGGALAGVDCVSVSSCTAVGVDGAGTLVESWDGSTWSIVPSPNSGSGSNQLTGVSCVTASSCTAVGVYTNASGTDQTLAESWNGSSWSIVSSPDNGTGANSLDGVSCPSASSCTAVGSYETASGVAQTLAEAWDGTTWSIQTSPNLTLGNNALVGVSCLSASACTAAGDAYSSTGNQYTLIERYS